MTFARERRSMTGDYDMTEKTFKTDSAYMENQRSIPLHPALARTFGDRAAIFLQQLRYWMETYSASEGTLPNEKRKHYRDGRWWAFNSYEQWKRDNFSFWSVSTIGRIVRDLENRGVLLSEAFHESDGDRTKWYTIDFDKLDVLVAEQEAQYQAEQKAESDPSCQNDTTIMSDCNDHHVKMARSINIDTESTTENTTKDDNNSDPVASSESPTPPPTKQEPEKPSRSRLDDPDLAKVSKAYENEIGMITQYVAGKLAEACDDYPTDWIVEAIGRAVEQNKRKWSYVNGILQNWRVEGKSEKTPNGSKSPTISPPDPNCPQCGGLGWYNVDEPGGGSHAETCACRKATVAA